VHGAVHEGVCYEYVVNSRKARRAAFGIRITALGLLGRVVFSRDEIRFKLDASKAIPSREVLIKGYK
jgi:hypothetical protein